MKKALITVGIIIVVIVIAVACVPLFVNANQFKPELESDLSSALGRQVQIGNISLSVWSGSVSVDNVSIADDPAFSSAPFLTAQQLKAGVALMPLIFHKRLEVLSFTINSPQVAIIRNAAGVWNFSSLGGQQAKAKSQPAASSSSTSSAEQISVQKLTLAGGKMTVSGAGGKQREYDGLDVEAENLSYTSQFPFSFSANTPGQGTVKLTGQAGPVNATDAAMTPLHATLAISHFDLSATGFVDPSSGLGGLVDFNGQLDSDGKVIDSHGTVTANSLKLTAGSSPSTVPLSVDYEATYDPQKEAGVLKRGDVHVGKALAALTGWYDTSKSVASVDMKMTGQGMSVPDLEGVLPALAVKLPSGASLQSGTLDVNLAINGPVDKLVITGPIEMANAKMAGFDLKGALGALSSFSGLGGGGNGATEIQELKGDLRIDPSGQQVSNLDLVVPSIGTLTGNGQASAAGDLDCKMTASLAGAGGVLTSVLGGGKSGVPFMIKGTTSHPQFVPDVSGMAKGFLSGTAGSGASGATDAKGAASSAASALGGLFGKKKTQ